MNIKTYTEDQPAFAKKFKCGDIVRRVDDDGDPESLDPRLRMITFQIVAVAGVHGPKVHMMETNGLRANSWNIYKCYESDLVLLEHSEGGAA